MRAPRQELLTVALRGDFSGNHLVKLFDGPGFFGGPFHNYFGQRTNVVCQVLPYFLNRQ